MNKYFSINDYFNEDVEVNQEVRLLRENINSFRTVKEQLEYIIQRRRNIDKKRFDLEMFGIPVDAELSLELQDILKNNAFDQLNEYYNGKNTNTEDLREKSLKNKIKRISKFKSYTKITIIFLIIFIILNLIIYVYGIASSVGPTPFDFCKGSTSMSSIKGFSKVKDGYKIPVDYGVAGEGYTGQGWQGDDNQRGIGVFASEDFLLNNNSNYSNEIYGIAARWEYVSYPVIKNKWPQHGQHGNGTKDGTGTPYTNLDSAQYQWVVKQKVLVRNPETGKTVICQVGNGTDNPNWGGSPLETVAGLSYLAQNALGFTAGGMNGTDYNTNVRDSNIKLEMYWAPEDATLGPGPIMKDGLGPVSSSACVPKLNGGGNASIADAAVSYAHESIEIGTPNSGPNNGNGTDLYVKLHDLIFPGDPWYQSCDRSVATAVRWSGADDNYPVGSVGNQISYLQSSDKWQEVPNPTKEALKPGDVLIAKTGGTSHTIMYVGNEAVRKKFPNSTGELMHGSIGGAGSAGSQSSDSTNRGPSIGNWYNMGLGSTFKVYRNVKPEENSKFKNILSGK